MDTSPSAYAWQPVCDDQRLSSRLASPLSFFVQCRAALSSRLLLPGRHERGAAVIACEMTNWRSGRAAEGDGLENR